MLFELDFPATPEYSQGYEVDGCARPDQGERRFAEGAVVSGGAEPDRGDDGANECNDGHPPEDERLVLACRFARLTQRALAGRFEVRIGAHVHSLVSSHVTVQGALNEREELHFLP